MEGISSIASNGIVFVFWDFGSRPVVWGFSVEIVPFGEVNVKINIVALEGVGVKGFDDVGRVIEGILSASKFNATCCILDLLGHSIYTYGEVKMHINITKVQNWSIYKEILGSKLQHNHNKCSRRSSTSSLRVYEGKLDRQNSRSNVNQKHNMGSHSWLPTPLLLLPKPIKASDFKDELILPIWGCEDTYLSGAIIKFAKSTDTKNFGFYVHIGTNATFDENTVPTDADYYRGYVGAAAIWVCAWRLAAEDAIKTAEKAIGKAEAEGKKGWKKQNSYLN